MERVNIDGKRWSWSNWAPYLYGKSRVLKSWALEKRVGASSFYLVMIHDILDLKIFIVNLSCHSYRSELFLRHQSISIQVSGKRIFKTAGTRMCLELHKYDFLNKSWWSFNVMITIVIWSVVVTMSVPISMVMSGISWFRPLWDIKATVILTYMDIWGIPGGSINWCHLFLCKWGQTNLCS